MARAADTRERRRAALELVEDELARLRAGGVAAVAALVSDSPVEERHGEIVVTARAHREGERMLVLVEAGTRRRMLATGGFAMEPDGSAHTPD